MKTGFVGVGQMGIHKAEQAQTAGERPGAGRKAVRPRFFGDPSVGTGRRDLD